MGAISFGDGNYDVWNDPFSPDPYVGGGYGPTDPPAQSRNPYEDSVRQWYRTYLGRDPENDQVVSAWAGQGAGAEAGIKNSQEAQAYAALRALAPSGGSAPAPATAPGSGGSVYDRIRAYQALHPASEGIGGIASALGLDRFMYGSTPSNNELVIGGQKYKVLGAEDSPATAYWYTGGDDSAPSSAGRAPAAWTGSTSGPYNDQSALLYLNQALSRLESLRQPVQDPLLDLLKQLGLDRVTSLRGSQPYTAGEDAALTAKYREPITQARDAAYQRNKEQASRRGFLPSSGLLRRLDTDVSRGYEQGIASGANDLAVRAVDEKQRRENEALQILSGLVTASATSRQENEARQREALNVAQLFPQFDEQRLNTLLRASGEGPSSLIGNLTSLASLNQNANQFAAGQAQQDSYAWAQLLYNIIHGIAG